MAGSTIFVEISEAIIRLLREKLVPDVIPNSESIGMCHPSDKGDIVLGLNIYDIRINPDIVPTDKIAVGTNEVRFPSSFYDLYFMITAYSASDIKFRSFEEARILGMVLQILKDNPTLRADLLGPSAASLQYMPKMELLDMENDEKMKLWNVPNMPYKLSLFYKVSPIEIESGKVKPVTRVTSTDFQVEESQRGKSGGDV